MKNNASHNRDPDFHQTCRRVVRGLIEKYEWALLPADRLVELVLGSIRAEVSPAKLEKLATYHYTIALYEACRQAEDPAQRERGYQELFRFLFRAAYNRWPDLAEVVAQGALALVYQQIDRCHSPATFLAFALHKLRQAFKDELRARGKELSLDDLPVEEISRLDPEEDQKSSQSALEQQERLQILVEAIKELPDERQQKVILLKFFNGLSDEAIATRLQITPGHVRVLRHRALKRLRENKRLRKYFEDEISRDS